MGLTADNLNILLTGGTGTFGHAFVVRCMSHYAERVRKLRVLARDEVKNSDMTADFAHYDPLTVIQGDVRDNDRMRQAVMGRVDVVIHAAALKRVDAGNYNPEEVVKTNVLGTTNVVNAAIQAQVPVVVVISSDKAVHPVNVYGATKFVAETFAVQQNAIGYPHGTKIVCVRYGNVIGSRGSVLNIWTAQHERGVPLEITDPGMTRFLMTINDAVDLVWHAIDHATGGEVWVPSLRSASVGNLALAAFPKDGQHLTGARPGDKRHEMLISPEERFRTHFDRQDYSDHKGYYLVTPARCTWGVTDWPGHPLDDPMSFSYTSDNRQMAVPDIQDYLGMT